MRRIKILLILELKETLRSPALLASMLSLPVTVVVVPLALLAYLSSAAPLSAQEFIRQLYSLQAESPTLLLVQAAGVTWLPIFLLMPVFLPILLAAQSVGGERERRTLEPLLATPVSTTEIVVAKSLAAVVPAVLLTWCAALIFLSGLNIMAYRDSAQLPFPDARWLLGVGILSPLLSIFGNAVAVIISSRVRDPRAAQNIAAMTVIPLLGLGIAQLAGSVQLSLTFYALFALILGVADLGLLRLAGLLFDREALLL